MDAIRLETTIEQDGRILVPGVKAGDKVEVIVLRIAAAGAKSYPLRGTAARYDKPFEPAIPEQEWDDRG